MSHTIMKQRAKMVEQGWKSILSTLSPETLTSASLMQKLAIIGLSNITYSREIFPPQCYDIHNISRTLLIPVLKQNTSCQEVNSFYQSVLSAFDALNKRYLKKITLNIYDGNQRPETIIESYSFGYKYGKDEIVIESSATSSSKHSIFTSSVESTTENLLRHLAFLFHSLDPLPDEVELVLQLIFNDVTPENYKPEGFNFSRNEEQLNDLAKYMLGEVSTPYHKMKVCAYIHSNLNIGSREHSDIPDDGEVTRDETPISLALRGKEKFSQNNENSENAFHTEFSGMSLSMPNKGNSGKSSIRCPCTTNMDEDQCMVRCNSCHIWQHAACFGLMQNDEDLLQLHICDECAANNSELVCSDQKIANLNQKKKKELCLFRNVLTRCLFYQEIDGAIFQNSFSISSKTVMKIFQRLNAYGIIKFSIPSEDNFDLSKSYRVDIQTLKYKIIPKFFPRSSIGNVNKEDVSENLQYDDIKMLSQSLLPIDEDAEILSPILTFPKSKKVVTDNNDNIFQLPKSNAVNKRRSFRLKRACKRYSDDYIDSSLMSEPKKVKGATSRLSLRKKDIAMQIS